MKLIGYRHQRTLCHPTELSGPGFITGAKVTVRLLPAPVDAGVLFVRPDLSGLPVLPARVDYVTSTQRRTTLGGGDGAITLVEHLLATLAGLRVDNCVIELDGPEPPGLDGSAQAFVDAVLAAGIESQPARRAIWAVQQPLTVQKAGATVSLHPPADDQLNGLVATYMLDYGPTAHIPRQSHTMPVSPDTFAREVANCRTFVTEREALTLVEHGIGKHLTARDLLVFGPNGLIDNELRHANEPARHKVLDLIGDLFLCGIDLVGHVVAYRSGHSLNVAMAKAVAVKARESGADLPPLLELPASMKRANFPGRRRAMV
ncbi:MAG: UDP-3-O-acyl-N-acetylglucosamine deacetylase [Fimbriiglobus sp.]|nr:UDP-3-O-acyl-N-acetylglucosamine deacetylase [Fimbriiglobus sp.]